ncbi:MAG TPA: hypothetical protein PKK52_00180 [Syntrophorhabdus sp.]|nr:hypothetical protein [Syntrophorhabdus sp.]
MVEFIRFSLSRLSRLIFSLLTFQFVFFTSFPSVLVRPAFPVNFGASDLQFCYNGTYNKALSRGFSMISKGWHILVNIISAVGVIGLLLAFPLLSRAVEVDSELMEHFKTNETGSYVIYFRAKASFAGAPNSSWKEQNEFINRALQDNANRSQARVVSYLFHHRVQYRSLWRDNTVIVEKSNKDVFEGLHSFNEIEAIRFYSSEPAAFSKTLPVGKTMSGEEDKP